MTLGRFDIHYAFSTLAQYSVAPRLGHLKAIQRVFGYLKRHPNGMIIVDDTTPPARQSAQFHRKCDWTEFFPGACEDLPTKCPHAYGDDVKITVFVDADHARNRLTRRSVTAILLLANNMPLVWISRR